MMMPHQITSGVIMPYGRTSANHRRPGLRRARRRAGRPGAMSTAESVAVLAITWPPRSRRVLLDERLPRLDRRAERRLAGDVVDQDRGHAVLDLSGLGAD